MSEQCNGDCQSCSEVCSERKEDAFAKLHPLSKVKHTIGVLSGKGGVGKSLTTALLAVAMNREGFKSAILDADITGPSIPKTLGITQKATGDESGIIPVTSNSGIDIISMNMILGDDTDPVVWRGPLLAGTVKQFWSDVIWHEIDYMFIDMPPGTGDVPLTVFQSIPVDGIIIVTSPQELVSMIVQKAVKMASLMNIPVLALVENMAYFECPKCHEKVEIFGKSGVEDIAKAYNIDITAQIPIDPKLSAASDSGTIEQYRGDYLKQVVEMLIKMEEGK